MSLGKENNWNFGDIFGGIINNYQINDITDEKLELYKKAYVKYKNKNPETKAKITLDIDSDTLILSNFTGVEMFDLGYYLREIKYESNNN